MGLEALYPKNKKNTSLQNKFHEVYKYLLDPYWQTSNGNRFIDVPRVNEVWSGDITYIRTLSGFVWDCRNPRNFIKLLGYNGHCFISKLPKI